MEGVATVHALDLEPAAHARPVLDELLLQRRREIRPPHLHLLRGFDVLPHTLRRCGDLDRPADDECTWLHGSMTSLLGFVTALPRSPALPGRGGRVAVEAGPHAEAERRTDLADHLGTERVAAD